MALDDGHVFKWGDEEMSLSKSAVSKKFWITTLILILKVDLPDKEGYIWSKACIWNASMNCHVNIQIA